MEELKCCPVCGTVSGSYGSNTKIENFKIHIRSKARKEAYDKWVLLRDIKTPHIDYINLVGVNELLLIK